MPGEYGQFDSGEVRVELADGREVRIAVFAGRLEYSRLMHVEIVEARVHASLTSGK